MKKTKKKSSARKAAKKATKKPARKIGKRKARDLLLTSVLDAELDQSFPASDVPSLIEPVGDARDMKRRAQKAKKTAKKK